MVTCFRISWGGRRQRVSSALFPSGPAGTWAQRASPHLLPGLQDLPPPPPRAAGCYPKAPWTSTLPGLCSHLRLQGALPPCILITTFPEAPLAPLPPSWLLADLEICLFLGSPVVLLKRTQKIHKLPHLQRIMPPGQPPFQLPTLNMPPGWASYHL